MEELCEKFKWAIEEVQKLSDRPNNEILLRLYALYKQATLGDVLGKKPGFTDFKGRAKFDAWEKIKGTTKEDAMKVYIDLVETLI